MDGRRGLSTSKWISLILIPVVGLIVPACDDGGTGTLTPTVAPGIPQRVTVKNGNGRVLVSWEPTAAATSYRVQRSTNPGGPYTVLPGADAVAGSSFGDTTVIRKTPYYYVVSARNTFGESGNSDEVRAVPNFTATIVSAGDTVSHVLLDDGTVWGWGDGIQGSMGNGTLSTSSNVAVELPGLADVVALSAGELNCLALVSDGTVMEWGAFELAPAPAVTVPTPVPGLTDVVSIDTGRQFNLALRSDGTVWAWGRNDRGQLGIDPLVNPGVVATPVQIPALSGVVAIAAGKYHALALKGDGTLWGWGENSDGELGNGGTADRFTVGQVANLTGVVAASAGETHSVAIREDGTVYSWGSFALGLGSTSTALLPTRIPGLSGVAAVSAGHHHCLALKVGGTVWAWGANDSAQLGNGAAPTGSNVPIQITDLNGIVAISAGHSHSLALGPEGSVWGWGRGGSVGSGTGGQQFVPGLVVNLTNVTTMASGGSHGIAVRPGGTVWCWGDNGFGQLGIMSTTDSSTAVQAQNLLANVTSVAGGFHTLARRSDGTVWAWGSNFAGQIGQSNLASHTIPFQIPSFTGVSDVAAGHSFSLALRSGGVWSFGQNNLGQLGLGTTGTGATFTPTQIASLSSITSLSAGTHHALALRSDGTVWAWGDNSQGQLGHNLGALSSAPVQVAGLTGVQAVAAGDKHSLALLNDGTIVGWGRNIDGELGSSTLPTPGQRLAVPGVSGATGVAAGFSSFAVLSDGTVWSWGPNTLGQLGDGTQTTRATPAPIAGLSNVATVASKFSHAYALRSDGMMMAWGSNMSGEAGNGLSGLVLTPIEIIR